MAITSNLDSNLDQLCEAKALMQKADKIKDSEKIFENEKWLKFVNLQNYKQAYNENNEKICEFVICFIIIGQISASIVLQPY